MNVSKEGAKITLIWDVAEVDDVEKARTFFISLTRQGWLAVYVSRADGKRLRILEFNPRHGELQFIPPSEGG